VLRTKRAARINKAHNDKAKPATAIGSSGDGKHDRLATPLRSVEWAPIDVD
jgi:hypothetical protein